MHLFFRTHAPSLTYSARAYSARATHSSHWKKQFRIFWLFAQLSGLIALSACDGCGGGPECGSQTLENEAGECVAKPQTQLECGANTQLVEGKCIATLSDSGTPNSSTCTLNDGGTCPPLECGPNTQLIDGECRPKLLPDAGLPDAGLLACDPTCIAGYYCSEIGVCTPTPRPPQWTCSPQLYRDGENCDCECGAPDPDCFDNTLPTQNCASNVCLNNGTCESCTPQCQNKQCGDDGCGGSCGECLAPGLGLCNNGTCESCTPQCDGKQCGDNGCGGSCGTCESTTECIIGQCEPPPVEASCDGNCTSFAPAGCSCKGECQALGNCCVDVEICGCLPQCENKECGDDGCGGLCGGCLDGELCSPQQLCTDNPCLPNPCSDFARCNEANGSCTCDEGYTGDACDACDTGFVGYPTCVFDLCTALDEDCANHGTCTPASGSCECEPGFSAPYCNACDDVNQVYPDCTP